MPLPECLLCLSQHGIDLLRAELFEFGEHLFGGWIDGTDDHVSPPQADSFSCSSFEMRLLRGSGSHPRGSGWPIRLRRTPMPCTSSSITSPGWNFLPCSAPLPVPTVPEPSSSPGQMVSPFEPQAIISSTFHVMLALQ